jgi:arylsulfatase A-like enzyme
MTTTPTIRPNILWITTDQQRWDTLGCLGNPHVRTPHLDRLAGDGALFPLAFCQSPVCTPSRASFLTGRYPRTTRCRQNGQDIPADEVLVTRLLRDAGWRCGLAGKLHLSACDPKVLQGRPERRIDDGYEDAAFFWHHDQWPWAAYGEWLDRLGLSRQFTALPGARHVEVGPPSHGTATAWAAAMAEGFIRQAPDDGRPWIFSLNLFDPHHPFRLPADRVEDWRGRVDGLPLPWRREGEDADKPVWQAIDRRGAYGGKGMTAAGMSDRDQRWIRAAYYAMVEDIDEKVGRLLAVLDETGQRDRTLVVFTSDHGEMLGDHGLYLKGPYFYEGAVRVPLILAMPGRVAPGTRRDALVELVDLAPTLLGACGLPEHPGMQGRSLWPLLADPDPSRPHRESVYCEYGNAGFRHDPRAWASMIRTARHKLVRAHGQEDGELYDLLADPHEQHNRWRQDDCVALRGDLLAALCDRIAFTADPLPQRRSSF